MGPGVRLALLAHHYRGDWEWRTQEDMPAAAARLALWRSSADGSGKGSAGLARARAALSDDLDTPAALAVLDAEASAALSVAQGPALLGVQL
jgi:L-cysteine:1D-myo-inositol 2-amino-2-deoxy-alpha-D-glucopyranoside ligase